MIGTPEYDAAMAKKFDNATTPTTETPPAPTKPQRPEWFPENLWKGDKSFEENAQALATSYAEARKTISQKQPPATPPATPPAADPNAAPAPTATPPAAPEAAKVDLKAAAAEYLEGGKLSEETYAKLAKVGIDKATADVQMAGVKALSDQYAQKAYARVGSAEQYTAMTTWAGNNLSPAEIAAFDAAVASGNEAQMLMAIDAVKGKFVEANGQPPQLLGGERPTGNVNAFRDRSEMTAAMKDPRYKTSPAYRKDVEQRLAASKFW